MKKNDDLFEFPCVDPDVAEANFFISEYCKRHFEEYADKKDVDFVLDKFKQYVSINDNDYKKALSKSRQILINYEHKINNRLIYDFYSIVEDKDIKFFDSWIEKAYKLTKKYKISVFDLLCPKNFFHVLKSVIENTFVPEVEIIFCNNVSDVGYEFKYDDKLKKIAMFVNVTEEVQDSELLASNAAIALVLLKRKIGLQTSNEDRNILIRSSKNDKNTNLRANGKYARAAGILIWDLRRLHGVSIEGAIIKLREKNLIYRRDVQCTELCKNCAQIKDCAKEFRRHYANACEAILESKIIPISNKEKTKKKFGSRPQFTRYDD